MMGELFLVRDGRLYSVELMVEGELCVRLNVLTEVYSELEPRVRLRVT